MVNIIEPKVEVVDYGPKIVDEHGKVVMTPDQLIYAAAGITFKDTEFFDQTRRVLEEEDIQQKIQDSLIASVGAGHASLTTTPGLWIALKGNCSKLVDSMFTGVRYGSSLMPSGRRVPVAKDQIVVPVGIAQRGVEAIDIYMRTSEANIDAYEKLMAEGVQKDEAAKIVQYGHRGGGFMFMPLETIVSIAHQFESNSDAIPLEGRSILNQWEDFIRNNGMSITYFSRKNAPRTGCPNPGIFHYGKSLTGIIETNEGNVQQNPILVSHDFRNNKKRDEKIKAWIEKRKEYFSTAEGVIKNWRNLLGELNGIINEFNDSVSATTIANTPWRVWGEDKRHRTLDQTAESVYNAADRLVRTVDREREYLNNWMPEAAAKAFESVFSMPPAVKKDDEKLKYWISRIVDSADCYDALRRMGIPESDAIHVVPRGIKFGVESRWNLYNMTAGKMSLRLCDTCEPEMRRKTELEKKLILENGLPEAVAELLTPKCSYVGFCPEGSYEKRCCKRVHSYVPCYSGEFHAEMQQARKDEILYQIKGGK